MDGHANKTTMDRSAGGLEYLIDEPEGGAVGAPLLICLHGRGSTPEKIQPWSAAIAHNWVRVLPVGPLASEAGRAWYLKGPDRAEQLACSRQALVRLVAELRARLGVGPERTAVWGFSQGGTLSLELGLALDAPLAATVCVAGILDPATAQDPARIGRARGREFFLVHGVNDEVVPFQSARDAYRALSSDGGRVELAELVMGHEVSPVALGAVRGFLASAVGAGVGPAKA